MNFTMEIEKTFEVLNNKLAFLDIDVFRDANLTNLKTTLYRKHTFTGIYTNFKSFIAVNYLAKKYIY